jgi:hypothetical protein
LEEAFLEDLEGFGRILSNGVELGLGMERVEALNGILNDGFGMRCLEGFLGLVEMRFVLMERFLFVFFGVLLYRLLSYLY